MNGAVGDLVAQAAIGHFPPAYVYFTLTAPGCEQLVTHLFDRGRGPGPTPAGDRCETP